jgi:hypothetical protein
MGDATCQWDYNAQPFAELLQQRVSHRVTELIVDAGQAIYVEKQYGARHVLGHPLRNDLLKRRSIVELRWRQTSAAVRLTRATKITGSRARLRWHFRREVSPQEVVHSTAKRDHGKNLVGWVGVAARNAQLIGGALFGHANYAVQVGRMA